MSSGEMRFEVCPSVFNSYFLVPRTTCAHEVARCKDFCIPDDDLFGVTDEDAPLLLRNLHNLGFG
jgi:hypothetical protein